MVHPSSLPSPPERAGSGGSVSPCSALSPLSAASRTARRSSPGSRVAFVSARAQPPSHTGDQRLTQPSGPSRAEPWLRLRPEGDAPGLIRAISGMRDCSLVALWT
eukprot:7390398-Prymnesium_polylepis.3